MTPSQRRGKFHIALIAIVSVISVIFYISSKGGGGVLSLPYSHIVYPIQATIYSATVGIGSQLRTIKEYEKIRTELLVAQAELVSYKTTFQELEILRKENSELRRLLKFNQEIGLNNIPAQIVSKDPQNFFTSLSINKGSIDGIRVGNSVVTVIAGKICLVGNVAAVSEKTATLQTITDPLCRVGVMLLGTTDSALLKGQSPNSISAKVEYIDIGIEELTGKDYVTSGMGGKYIKNIFVGKVTEVIKKRYGLFQSAFIEPYVNFFTLESVLVLVEK